MSESQASRAQEGGVTRRGFARQLGAAIGAALIAPRLMESVAEARLPAGAQGDFIQLNSNENPYGPSAKALEAITRSKRVVSRYPDALETRVVEALAKLHSVEPANVLLGCGSGEILRIADMAFLDPEKNVVVAEPTFEAVLSYARVTSAHPVKVPLTGDFRHDLEAMAAAADQRTGLVYICNPNNPTGTVVTRDELAAFFPRVPKSAVVLVDEAYYHFAEDPRYVSALEWFGKLPSLVVTRTFSKVYGMAGMRLGYAVASKELIGAMREHKLSNNSNNAVLEAALASLVDPGHVRKHRQLNNDTRRWFCEQLQRQGRRYIPSEANFVMIEVGSDVTPVIEGFRQRRILVGRKFPSMGNWLRVSIGTRKEMEMFLGSLEQIVPAAQTPGKAA